MDCDLDEVHYCIHLYMYTCTNTTRVHDMTLYMYMYVAASNMLVHNCTVHVHSSSGRQP